LALHPEKKAIRALGVAESFSQSDSYSVLAGAVMRSDLVIDGFGIGSLEVAGSDATDAIARLFRDLKRDDINIVLLSGSVLSLYNIVDVDLLHTRIRKPILALTFKMAQSNLARNISARFVPEIADTKIEMLEKLGAPQRFRLHTNYQIFVRLAGISNLDAQKVLDKFTLQGSIPEPIRVARLFAKVLSAFRRKSMIMEKEKPG
jgi:endonuclease V-like protein UPF0215 family